MRTVPVPTTAAAAVAPAVQAVIPAVAAFVPAAPAIMVLAAAPAVSAIPPVAAPAVPTIFPAAAVEPAVPATSAVASPAPPTTSGSSSPVTPTVRRSGRPPRNLPPKLSPEALLDSGARSASPPTNHQHVLIQELTDINRAQREHHSLFLRESLVEFRHLVRHVVTDPDFRPQQQQASEVNDHARQLGKLLIYSFIY